MQTQQDNTFNKAQYEETLRTGGTCTKYESRLPPNACSQLGIPLDDNKAITIEKEEAKIKGNGYGTAVMRQTVSESFARGFHGNVHVDASWSSHLFHVYMGMVPVDRPINYILYQYGSNGKKIFDEFKKKPDLDNLQRLFSEDKRGYLRDMMLDAKGLPENSTLPNEVFSSEENIPLLLALEKKYTYVTGQFIPELLSCLPDNPSIPIDTHHLGSVHMVLSQEGKQRWNDAIERNIEFKPFKQWEHLRPYMSESQIESLNEKLEKRASILAKAEVNDARKITSRFKEALDHGSSDTEHLNHKP